MEFGLIGSTAESGSKHSKNPDLDRPHRQRVKTTPDYDTTILFLTRYGKTRFHLPDHRSFARLPYAPTMGLMCCHYRNTQRHAKSR